MNEIMNRASLVELPVPTIVKMNYNGTENFEEEEEEQDFEHC